MAIYWLLTAWLSAFVMWSLPVTNDARAFVLRCAGTLGVLSTLVAGAARGPILALMAVVALAAVSRLLNVPLRASCGETRAQARTSSEREVQHPRRQLL